MARVRPELLEPSKGTTTMPAATDTSEPYSFMCGCNRWRLSDTCISVKVGDIVHTETVCTNTAFKGSTVYREIKCSCGKFKVTNLPDYYSDDGVKHTKDGCGTKINGTVTATDVAPAPFAAAPWAERAFRFLCHLNMQDHGKAEQEEYLAVVREMKAALWVQTPKRKKPKSVHANAVNACAQCRHTDRHTRYGRDGGGCRATGCSCCALEWRSK